MPQPDNQQTRGFYLPREQQQVVAPEGSSGVYNTYGVAQNVAVSQKMTGLQIGQQARIVDDGSSLWMALEGLAKGIAGGAEQYEKFATRVAEKNQNDWETELIEFGRTVNNDPKKMAEWSRNSSYRPNSRTAKRYNTILAQMEGKEYDAYQDDIINRVSRAASQMDLDSAARFYDAEMRQLDPNDKAYKYMFDATNKINQQMYAISTELELKRTGDNYDLTLFDLGAELRKNGITAADLDNERANTIATALNLWGNDPNRLRVDPQTGDIFYTTKGENAMSIEGSFRGGLSDDLINAIREDIGTEAGNITDGTFNPRLAANIELAMKHGKFNSQHTSRGQSRSGDIFKVDSILNILASESGNSQAAVAMLFGGLANADGTLQQQRTRVGSGLNDIVASIENSDAPPHVKIKQLTNFLLVSNPEEHPQVYGQLGYADDLQNSALTGPRDRARQLIKTLAVDESLRIATEVDRGLQLNLDPVMYAQFASQGVAATAATLGANGNNTIVELADRTKLTTADELAARNGNDLVDAFVYVINPDLTENEFLGNGVILGPGPDAHIPQEAIAWRNARRQDYNDVQNFDNVQTMIRQGQPVNEEQATRAVNTVMRKLPATPTVEQALGVVDLVYRLSIAEGSNNAQVFAAQLMDNSSTGAWARISTTLRLPADQTRAFAFADRSDLASAPPELKLMMLYRSMLGNTKTQELAGHLLGGKNSRTVFDLTTAPLLVDQYKELNDGAVPDLRWLDTAYAFKSTAGIRERAMTLVSDLRTLVAETSPNDTGVKGQMLYAIMSDNELGPGVPTTARVYQELRKRWDAAHENEDQKFENIMRTPNHPDTAALDNWLLRQIGSIEGAAGIMVMTQTSAWSNTKRITREGQDPIALDQDRMILAALKAMDTAGDLGMTPTVANAATKMTAADLERFNTPLSVEHQAIAEGLQHIQMIIQSPQKGAVTSEGDMLTLLNKLGVFDDVLSRGGLIGADNLKADQEFVDLLARGLFNEARLLARKRNTTNQASGEYRFNQVIQALGKVMRPVTDTAATSESRNITNAYFRVYFDFVNPFDDIDRWAVPTFQREALNPGEEFTTFTIRENPQQSQVTTTAEALVPSSS